PHRGRDPRRRGHVLGPRGRAVRPPPVRRARRPHPVGERGPAHPGRRVHGLHGKDHPRRRGGQPAPADGGRVPEKAGRPGAMFTALFSAGSIVWDREFGFLREMLVAPVRRSAIVVGKCVGGATVATFQGLIVLSLAGFVGVPYSPPLMLALVAELLLLSFTLT